MDNLTRPHRTFLGTVGDHEADEGMSKWDTGERHDGLRRGFQPVRKTCPGERPASSGAIPTAGGVTFVTLEDEDGMVNVVI